MRSIHVPADQLEGQYQVFRGESNEGAILLRMERKYRRLLYHNRIPFFDKCSIDSEARPIVLKYRAEYGVHAYKNCQRDAKNCWWNRSLVSTKGIQATFKYYYSYSQQKYKISF
jgi:hypothetical protein